MITLALALLLPANLDQKIETFRTQNGVVGMAVCVEREGKQVYSKTFGFRDREANQPSQTSDLYRLGSVSKSLTAIAAMSLVQDNKLDLDAGANPAIPELPKGFPTLTVRQLLNHTAGIRHYQGVGDPTSRSFTKYPSAAAAMALFAKDLPLTKPGEKHAYSTHGYTYAARVLESIEQKPIAEILNQRVFKYTTDVDVEWIDVNKPQRTALYNKGASETTLYAKREDNSWKFAGGGMEATAPGLAKLGSALLEGKILDAKNLKEMWTPINGGSYALGFVVAADGSISHSGAQQGCRAVWRFDPAKQEVVVILCNTSGSINVSELAVQVSNGL